MLSGGGGGKKGRSQQAAYKPFGTQRKEKKESVADQKEKKQVWFFPMLNFRTSLCYWLVDAIIGRV